MRVPDYMRVPQPRVLSFKIFCLLAFVLTIALGTWQIYRLQWKQDLLLKIEVQQSKDVKHLPILLDDREALDYQQVKIFGKFRNDLEQLLGPRSHKRVSGYNVITPFVLNDGRHILVNRGWVPATYRDTRHRLAGQIARPIELIGVLRTNFARNMFTPTNDVDSRLWYWYDIVGLSAELRLPLVPAVLEQKLPSVAGGLPLPIGGKRSLPNNHLEYAVTWYLLSIVIAFMYVAWSFRKS